MNQTTRFTISALSAELQMTPRTIRFWEDQGLITPQREGGKRVYSRRDRTRLKLALRGKRLGFSLAEIKDLINMYDADRDDRQQLATLLGALSMRRQALEQQREDIEAVLGELVKFETVCRQALGQEDVGLALEGGEVAQLTQLAEGTELTAPKAALKQTS